MPTTATETKYASFIRVYKLCSTHVSLIYLEVIPELPELSAFKFTLFESTFLATRTSQPCRAPTENSPGVRTKIHQAGSSYRALTLQRPRTTVDCEKLVQNMPIRRTSLTIMQGISRINNRLTGSVIGGAFHTAADEPRSSGVGSHQNHRGVSFNKKKLDPSVTLQQLAVPGKMHHQAKSGLKRITVVNPAAQLPHSLSSLSRME
jgi:hypothetical protein